MFKFISDMICAAKKSYQSAVAERKARELANEKATTAKLFNNLYAYRMRYDESTDDRLPGTGMWGFTPKIGNAWMCPTCNKVHLATSCSAFSGLQYPKCCNHGEGHRLDERIRTS